MSVFKILNEKQVAEKCDLQVYECACGFHLGLDATFLDQVSEIKIACPSCAALLDTEVIE